MIMKNIQQELFIFLDGFKILLTLRYDMNPVSWT